MATLQEETFVTASRQLIADLYSLYFRAHGAHWNVEGPFFGPLHDFFAKIYDDVHDSIDPVAEGLRFHKFYAPATVGFVLSTTNIADVQVKGGNPTEHLQAVLDANTDVLTSLHAAFNASESLGDVGLANFFQDRIMQHDKWAWQLRSHLKSV